MQSYNKNACAPVPPMGWNSYDYYNTLVNEEQVRANADYMAKKLRPHGWEYVVIDIQWSDPDAGKRNADGIQYIPFSQFCLDEYSRQIPAPNRFPSSSGGRGFKPLADYIHSLGLKFGIHIMRGIPRFAAHNHLAIKTHDGKKITADMIANPYSLSRWNPDMYGVDASRPYAQDYYNSVFELYAGWGIDFVKVDDICNTNMYPANPYSAEKEIEMIARAIECCGRPIVLSLSPGPALIEKAHHYKRFANMWRITDDFWDDWRLLKAMFERCEVWQCHTGGGCWPDCDMLPLNVLGYGWAPADAKSKGWKSKFSREETRTMITLWSIFRSPLMLGTDLPQLDDFNLSLITNDEILEMNRCPNQAYQVNNSCNEEVVIWVNLAKETETECEWYECYFNVSETEQTVRLSLPEGHSARDLWAQKPLPMELELTLEPHSCRALKITRG